MVWRPGNVVGGIGGKINGGELRENGLGIPIIGTTQDFIHRDGFGLTVGQLTRPFYARRRIRARAGAVEFGVARRLFTCRVPPIVPAGRTNHAGHFRVQKGHAGIGPPWSAQISLHVGIFTGDLAMRKNITERMIRRC